MANTRLVAFVACAQPATIAQAVQPPPRPTSCNAQTTLTHSKAQQAQAIATSAPPASLAQLRTSLRSPVMRATTRPKATWTATSARRATTARTRPMPQSRSPLPATILSLVRATSRRSRLAMAGSHSTQSLSSAVRAPTGTQVTAPARCVMLVNTAPMPVTPSAMHSSIALAASTVCKARQSARSVRLALSAQARQRHPQLRATHALMANTLLVAQLRAPIAPQVMNARIAALCPQSALSALTALEIRPSARNAQLVWTV